MFTALIVDDNPTFRRSVKKILSGRFPRMSIREAANGRETMRLIEISPPDLIFVDIRLPLENGLRLTERIKRHNPQLPVVILTSHDTEEYREAASAAGAEYFVSKGSSTWEEVSRIVESFLVIGPPATADPEHKEP
jgi:DNA-binding NarL/FixJ family response regulator